MNTRIQTQPGQFFKAVCLLLGVGFFAASMLGGSALRASAVESGNLGIRPSNEVDFFHLSVRPGEQVRATAIVSNRSAQPVSLSTYPVDGLTTSTGAFSLKSQKGTRLAIGTWTALTADTITVPANSERPVPFTISVPAGTNPGDYSGALIIQAAPVPGATADSNGTAVRIDVVQRQGVRIYLHVVGTAVVTMSAGPLGYDRHNGTVTLTLPVTNTGNTTLHPTASVQLSEWPAPNSVANFSIPESVPPGETVIMSATIKSSGLLQIGKAAATIKSAAGQDTIEKSVFVVPVPLLIAGILVTALIAFGLTIGIRFVRKARRALNELARQQKRQARRDQLELLVTAARVPVE